MGVYLNSKTPVSLFEEEANSLYFVDKTNLLATLLQLFEQGNKYFCITRPRRFGKTMAAHMLASFLGKESGSRAFFESFGIGGSKLFARHANQYNIIYISMNEIPKNCSSYAQYISRIEGRLYKDLKAAFPVYDFTREDAVWDILDEVYENETDARFVFLFDEWDYIFHRDFVTEADKAAYLEFLSNLLKGKAYVSFAYMTGILPIAKYSSGSELNMFLEYSMVTEAAFGDCFGFTDTEVDMLYARYQQNQRSRRVTREGLRLWYDGYVTCTGERVYNPRSVVCALLNNNLGSYWTSAGPYDEIYFYLEKNVADIREPVARMVAKESVPAKIREYAATSQHLGTKDEIFSAMVVYGFLSYENGCVSIPNKELMIQFERLLQKEPSLGYVYRLAKESERMLQATLAQDADTIAELLEYAHNTEVPLLSYNHESDLTAVVNLVYLAARDVYRIEREDKAGTGYVDFIFYPDQDPSLPGIILELKIGGKPEAAIQQIRERKYALRFQNKLGEVSKHNKTVLAVGIAYDKKDKKHRCKIERLDAGLADG